MKCLLKWIAALAVVAGLLALAAALLCRTREPEEYITLYKDEYTGRSPLRPHSCSGDLLSWACAWAGPVRQVSSASTAENGASAPCRQPCARRQGAWPSGVWPP